MKSNNYLFTSAPPTIEKLGMAYMFVHRMWIYQGSDFDIHTTKYFAS